MGREMAKALAVTKNPEPELMFEGQEKGSFWSDLGGKQDYFTDLVSRQEDDVPEPRLFQLSSATGNITVEEVVDFSQEDLIEEDVMILDAGHSVFAWFGALSTRQEQQESVRIAREYLESCPNDRDVDTPVIKIRMGLEPPNSPASLVPGTRQGGIRGALRQPRGGAFGGGDGQRTRGRGSCWGKRLLLLRRSLCRHLPAARERRPWEEGRVPHRR